MKGVLVFISLLSLAFGYSIWPQPVEFTRGTTQLGVGPTTLKVTTSSNSIILKGAIARYQRIFFPFETTASAPGVPILNSLTINVASTNEVLQFGFDENYTLSVNQNTAVINADTVFGALRGLESFSQLIDYDLTDNYYTISDTPISVTDYPRFPWRGIMIDTSRHFLQVPTILTMIDALAYNKMNTLHWHVTDAQSFPIIIESYPNLAIDGAYQYPEATYSHEEVQMIVQYGYERGVRVVPEFDIPGHSYSWGLGYPEAVINCTVPYWGTSSATLNIISNYTYELLDGFIGEVKTLFMDSFMHFGSDEVLFDCWNQTEAVISWMEENNIPKGAFYLVEQYFEDQLQILTNKHQIQNRIFWEDAFADNGVKFDTATTTFEIWLGASHLVESIQAGFKTILAYGNYLDVQKPGSTIHYEWVDTWQDFYTNEPFSGEAANLTAAERELFIGAEACMWGEAVEDENIFSRVWVRASGTAEKLWSTYNFTMNFDEGAAQDRIVELRCRLKRRGIRATAIRPDYCPAPFFD